MTADLQELFDRAGRNPPAPTLDPDAVLRQARRSRNRRVWMSAVAVGVAAAAVAVVGLAGGGPRRAGPLPPAHPSPTPSAYALAAEPFLTEADLASWSPGMSSPASAVIPFRLSPCQTDPLAWGATQVAAETYQSHPAAGVFVNEFVLRFADSAAAHRALLEAWRQIRACPPPASDEPVARPSAASLGPAHPILDEFFADQRGLPTDPQAIRAADIYAIRVARAGNVLVVIEDTGITSDQPEYMLALAMIRAIPNYLATHVAALCVVNDPLCPPDVYNSPPGNGG